MTLLTSRALEAIAFTPFDWGTRHAMDRLAQCSMYADAIKSMMHLCLLSRIPHRTYNKRCSTSNTKAAAEALALHAEIFWEVQVLEAIKLTKNYHHSHRPLWIRMDSPFSFKVHMSPACQQAATLYAGPNTFSDRWGAYFITISMSTVPSLGEGGNMCRHMRSLARPSCSFSAIPFQIQLC